MATASLGRYIEQAKVENLQREWEKKGYEVRRDQTIEGHLADLVATRGDQTVVIEVKTSESLKRNRRLIAQLAESVERLPNHRFRLVIANPPKERSFEIDGLGDSLREYLINNLPSELDSLGSHAYVEAVEDVEVDDVVVSKGTIRAAGTAAVTVRLEYGSASDVESGERLVTEETFPLAFEVTLNGDLELVAVEKLEVDTSSFYE